MISLKGLNSASRIFLFTGIVLLPLSLVEYLFGFWYGSFILIADSYHGFIDTFSAFFYSIVLRIIYRKSKRFPLGKYNLESLGILLASIVVLFLSLNLIIDAIRENQSSINSWFALLTWIPAVVTFSIYIAERKYSWIGLVRADIAHSKFDVLTEIASGFAIILDNSLVTLLMILVIVGFVILDTARELKEAIMSLIGATLDSPIRDTVIEKMRKVGINALSTSVRKVGSFYSISVVIGLPSNTTLKEAYRIRKKAYRIINSIDNIALVEIKVIPLRNLKAKGKRKSTLSQIKH